MITHYTNGISQVAIILFTMMMTTTIIFDSAITYHIIRRTYIIISNISQKRRNRLAIVKPMIKPTTILTPFSTIPKIINISSIIVSHLFTLFSFLLVIFTLIHPFFLYLFLYSGFTVTLLIFLFFLIFVPFILFQTSYTFVHRLSYHIYA